MLTQRGLIVTDVWEEPIRSTFKGSRLTLEGGTVRLSRNVGNLRPIHAVLTSNKREDYHHHHHHHTSVMELGHLLTRSGLTYPEVSSKVYHNSFCQLGNSVSLPWVICYEAFYLHVVSSFSCIPVICPELVLFLIPFQFVYLFCNLFKCILLVLSYISNVNLTVPSVKF
jgi:hypothetical protein